MSHWHVLKWKIYNKKKQYLITNIMGHNFESDTTGEKQRNHFLRVVKLIFRKTNEF